MMMHARCARGRYNLTDARASGVAGGCSAGELTQPLVVGRVDLAASLSSSSTSSAAPASSVPHSVGSAGGGGGGGSSFCDPGNEVYVPRRTQRPLVCLLLVRPCLPDTNIADFVSRFAARSPASLPSFLFVQQQQGATTPQLPADQAFAAAAARVADIAGRLVVTTPDAAFDAGAPMVAAAVDGVWRGPPENIFLHGAMAWASPCVGPCGRLALRCLVAVS